MAAKTLKNPFLEGGENQIRKEKPKFTISVVLVIKFSNNLPKKTLLSEFFFT